MNKKILSILIASMLIEQSSVGIFAMPKGGTEASNSQSAEGSACDENQVDGFTLVRQLKKDGQRIFVYTHDKTGAQVVVFPDNDHSHMNLFFKVPSEDNKGTAHVLEHLLAVPFIRGQLEGMLGNYVTNGSGIRVFDIEKQALKPVLSYIQKPEFLTNKLIFDIESHSEFTNQRGTKFNRGRVLMEQLNESYEKFLVQQFMENNTKLKFVSGGIPEEILKMEHQEVCDLYRKYIHPSNSLASIYGSDYKSMMETFASEYLNHYEKKEVEVEYKLENAENLGFRELEVQKQNAAFECWNGEALVDSIYKAKIGYDLGGLKDKELDMFRKKCEIINSKEFQEKVRCKGYIGVYANVERSLRPYLKLEVFGSNEQKFTQENLQSLANDIMRDEMSIQMKDDVYDDVFATYKSAILRGLIEDSFAFHNDPFSENYFTIEGDEIKKQDLNNIDFNNQVYLERTSAPAEIMVLKKSSQANEQPDVPNYKFKFNFKDNNNQLLTKVSMKAIYEQIIRKFKDKGTFYDFSQRCLDEERSFVTHEILGAIELEDFLKNDFQSCARDFVLESETFEKIKKELSESEKQQLDEITFEEVQNFIRSASFDSVIKE